MEVPPKAVKFHTQKLTTCTPNQSPPSVLHLIWRSQWIIRGPMAMGMMLDYFFINLQQWVRHYWQFHFVDVRCTLWCRVGGHLPQNSLSHLHREILFYSTSHTKDKMKQSLQLHWNYKRETALYLCNLTNHRPPLVISFPTISMPPVWGKLHSPGQPVIDASKDNVDWFQVGSDQRCRELHEGQDIGSCCPGIQLWMSENV